MPAPKPPISATVIAQRDFSAGEVDATLKRGDDHPIMRAGLRQGRNFRILNSRSLQNRPGRTAICSVVAAPASVRTEEIQNNGVTFLLVFSPGTLTLKNALGITVFITAAPWVSPNLGQIVFASIGLSIYFTYPGMAPLQMSWDGNSPATWSAFAFTFLSTAGGQVRKPFYRQSPKGIAMLPSATTGNINITFSAAVLSAGSVGTLMRFCGRQLRVTAATTSTAGTATVIEPLPPGEVLKVATDPRVVFNLGDEIIGDTSNAKGVVTAMDATHITVQLLQATTSPVTIASGVSQGDAGIPATTSSTNNVLGFIANEIVSGAGSSVQITNAGSDVTITTPQGVAVWDEEVINSLRGYPASVFADHDRLGFCAIPGLPRAIVWSAQGSPNDFYVGATPDAAMMEFAPPDVGAVVYVVAGPEGSEFVFGTQRIYYIPVSATNPLKPGSVAFQLLSSDGCAAFVQPKAVEEVIIYIGSGGKSVMSVVAPGAYYRPFETRNLSEFHGHLINSPVAIAIPTATGTFEERYFYILNSDGTAVVGKYAVESGQIKGAVGFVPWSGGGNINWISAVGADVIFTTVYGGQGSAIIERLDDTQYLDAAMSVNNPPAGLVAAGRGPLWWIPDHAVTLIDLGTRFMGDYMTDANGNIIPQFIAGENLASPQLVAGQPWTAIAEPFVPGVQPSGGGLTRMFKRRVRRLQVYVASSSGFLSARLRSGAQGVNLPALGTIMAQRRVTTWNQDDDPTQPPPLREQSYEFKPLGRDHDPREAIIKDTPGPLQILEIGMEVTT